MALDLTAIVLTYNEEIDLPACLDSLGRLECRIVVVDSGSDDRTVDIARQAGAEVFHHEFESQAQQLNWALDNVPMDAEWLLRLDADERITPELADELTERLARPADGVTGLYFKRREYFMGRWIRHGGYYPTWLLRVWKRGAARCEDRSMDEHMVLSEGEAAFLDHDIVEESGKGLSDGRRNTTGTRSGRRRPSWPARAMGESARRRSGRRSRGGGGCATASTGERRCSRGRFCTSGTGTSSGWASSTDGRASSSTSCRAAGTGSRWTPCFTSRGPRAGLRK